MVRVAALVAAALLGLPVSACTKVNEQPVLPPPSDPAPTAPAVKKPARPRPSRWQGQSTFSSDPTPAPVPAARAPAQPATTDTLNGDQNGLKPEVLQKALDDALPAFGACFEGTEGSVNVALTFEVDPSGRSTGFKVSGVPDPAERCLGGVVAGLRLPAFSGQPVPVRFPLSIHRAPSKKPAPEPERAAAAASPVFVNP